MNEDKPKWYENPVARVIILLLLGAIALGLYVWTTRIAIEKPPSPPITPNEAGEDGG